MIEATTQSGMSMKLKSLTVFLMTTVLSVAALASEHRRACIESVAHDSVQIEGVHEIHVVTKVVNVAN